MFDLSLSSFILAARELSSPKNAEYGLFSLTSLRLTDSPSLVIFSRILASPDLRLFYSLTVVI